MGSTRLPGKIFQDLSGKPILEHVIDRCEKSKANTVIVATSTKKENDIIEKFCEDKEILFFRGSEEDVLERYYECAKENGLDIIIRITSDCPLIDPETINHCLEKFESEKVDYLSNAHERSFPRGLDVEVFSFETLEKAHKEAKEKPYREHVTPFIYNNPDKFSIGSLIAEEMLRRPEIRLTVDTPEDLKLMKIIYKRLYKNGFVKIAEVMEFLENNEDLSKINFESEKEQITKNISEGITHKFIRN